MNNSFLGVLLVFIAVMIAVVYFGTKSGFRGEGIGDRTGGSAYSGAAAELDPAAY